MLWHRTTLLIIFIFFPSIDYLVGNVVVVIFMETNNTSVALNTRLAFNVIYPSHSTGKHCFPLLSIRTSFCLSHLSCDFGQVILSKFQVSHLTKGNGSSNCTGPWRGQNKRKYAKQLIRQRHTDVSPSSLSLQYSPHCWRWNSVLFHQFYIEVWQCEIYQSQISQEV